MKKIECHISDEKSAEIDKICDKEGYTRAEFNRRALENYLYSLSHKEITIYPETIEDAVKHIKFIK